VTSIWETIEKPVELLEYLKGKLNNNGRLFILMNNRLGLRYFCGDRDKYTGTVLDCLEDYHNTALNNNGRMYDKVQMGKILNGAGFEHFQFFSVFTDLDNPSLRPSENAVITPFLDVFSIILGIKIAPFTSHH
jgi:hypothetical protein